MTYFRFGRGCLRSFSAAAVLAALCLAGPPSAFGQAFPYGRELLLDAIPMRGSKKLPVLDIGDRGSAEIDLWCNSVKAQLVVAGNTITIITGEMTARACGPALAKADDDLIAALNQVTNWRMENSALIFTGGQTLRFRIQTN